MNDYQSNLPNIQDFARRAIENDLNPAALDLESTQFKQAPNCVSWVASKEFVGYNPYPRQVQVFTHLYEEYCPVCSDQTVLEDMWGMSLQDICSKVSMLDKGVCLGCKKTKADFHAQGLFRNYNELVGVAGQRCLHPDTPINTPYGVRPLGSMRVGDKISAPNDRGFQVVSAVSMTLHPGYFVVHYGKGRQLIAGDSHQWIVSRNGQQIEVCTPNLMRGDELYTWDPKTQRMIANLPIYKIEKFRMSIPLFDITVKGQLFLGSENEVLHNSGKSATVGMIATYHLHRLLMLPSTPASYYGLTAKSEVQMTFVAVTSSQVQESLWQSFLDVFQSSPWMKTYLGYLDAKKQEDGKDHYRWPETFIEFRNKRLKIKYSPAGQAGLRGRTRVFSAIDEMAWTNPDPKAKIASGPGVYAALSNSLRTVRSACNQIRNQGAVNPLDGMMCNIGSPLEESDPLMKLLYDSREKTKIHAFHYPTWEFNPNITFEDLQDELRANPAVFWRDFGAIPPASNQAFIDRAEAVDAIIDPNMRPLTDVAFTTFERKIADSTYRYIRPVINKFTVPEKTGYLVTCDAGLTDNCFAIMLSHWDRIRDRGVIDLMIEIEPSVDADGNTISVHFPSAIEFILGSHIKSAIPGQGKVTGLRDILPIWAVYYDRWQSTEHVQQVRDRGIKAETYSLKLTDFNNFRSQIYNGKWVIPNPEGNEKEFPMPPMSMPILRLVKQAKRVRQVGLKIVKPASGSDDIFRCWALADAVFSRHMADYSRFCNSIQPQSRTAKARGPSVTLHQLHKSGYGVQTVTNNQGGINSGQFRK